ncbi:MAG: hypothetical protein JO005_13610 [Gammaproteobacteria bacterium]|nr:hypothetical protein [Gammaproteobacteria bacterium]
MNRRDSLRVVCGAIWSAALARWGGLEARGATAAADGTEPTTHDADATLEERLKQDVERLGPRVYSDEGITVFLACIEVHARGSSAAALLPFNAELARQIHDTADAWERLYPQAKDEDVSKLIEVLAERDFATRTASAGEAAP